MRERLSPLKHEPNLARLFLLPGALTRRLLRKKHPEISDARLFQCALALAILTVCPLRIGALCSIRIDRHLKWSAGDLAGDLIVKFEEGELKGDEPASFPIPKDVAELIRAFCKRFRPLLNPCGSPFLFNCQDPNKPKDKFGFSTRLTRLIFKRLGLWVNPHLYRHIVHLVVLRKFPGAYAMVARVLTHRSIATTIRNYSHFDGELAMRAYQRLVEQVKVGGRHDGSPDLDATAYCRSAGRTTPMSRAKSHKPLAISEWPELDRQAWRRANEAGDEFTGSGIATTWARDPLKMPNLPMAALLVGSHRNGHLRAVCRVGERLVMEDLCALGRNCLVS